MIGYAKNRPPWVGGLSAHRCSETCPPRDGSQNVAVTTNVDTWTVKSDKNWCHPSADGKALKISVDESDERYVRKATVTVIAADQTKTITVRQLGYEAAILVDQSSFEVGVIRSESVV